MILQSLITDSRRISFDCCKKTMMKNDILELPDSMYQNAEIQGAIKLGLIRIVGDAPIKETATITKLPEKRVKNISTLKIGLDCIKGVVMPGQTVTIPEDKFSSMEVQNAISMNVLMDLDNPAQVAQGQTFEAGVLNEVTNADIKQTPAKKNVQAKKVGDGVTMGEDENSSDDFYKPSEVLVPKPKIKGKAKPAVVAPPPPPTQEAIDETMAAIEEASDVPPPPPPAPEGKQASNSEKQEEDPLSFLFEN